MKYLWGEFIGWLVVALILLEIGGAVLGWMIFTMLGLAVPVLFWAVLLGA